MPGTGGGAASADCELFRGLLSSYTLDPGTTNNKERECLITHEPLSTRHVILPCGHAFNYDMLFKEIARQKLHRRYNERPRLGENQMRCPYCNVVHDALLPPCRGYEPLRRVNSPIKWSLIATPCQHVFARGARQGKACDGPSLCGEHRCKRHASRPAPG